MSWIILKTSPEKISFVFDSMTDNQSEMVFLKSSARTNHSFKMEKRKLQSLILELPRIWNS